MRVYRYETKNNVNVNKDGALSFEMQDVRLLWYIVVSKWDKKLNSLHDSL